MSKSKRIKILEEKVKELSLILKASQKIINDYLVRNGEDNKAYYLFTMDNVLDEVYCFVHSVDSRIKKLENNIKGV